MSDTTYRPDDTDNKILQKILLKLGGTPRPGDFDNTLYRKILEALGGIFSPGDETNNLLRKIADKVSAHPRPGDTTNKLLYRIVDALHGVPKPGDYDNILLRKILVAGFAPPTPPVLPPAAPVATAATNVTATSFSANWNASSGATSYRLDVSTSNVFASFVPGFQNLSVGNVTTFSVTGLTGGTTYYYRLRASNTGGTSANSNTISLLTVPAAPVATAATNIAGTSFSANWNASAGATDYQIDVSTSNVFASFVPGFQDLSVGNVTTFSVTGLTASTTYYYRVRASNAGGTSASSNTVSVTTAPAAPVATAATAITGTSFSANWNASTGATDYRLDVSTSNVFASFVPGFQNLSVGNVITFSVTGLTAATTYYYRVRATNGATSADSNTISLTTDTPEVSDWVSRVVGNGGSVSDSTKNAANTFIASVNAVSGLRAKILRLNLYAGTGFAAAQVPFIKDAGSALDLPIFAATSGSGSDFTYVETGATGGLVPLTPGIALDTGLLTSNFSGDGYAKCSLGVYVKTPLNETSVTAGTQDLFNTNTAFMILAGYSDTNFYFYGFSTSVDVHFSDSNGIGFYQGVRTSSTSMTIYKNGTSRATNNSATLVQPPASNLSVTVHAYRTTVSAASQPSTKKLLGYVIGKDFDATQASGLYSALLAFNTSLTRQP